MPHLDQVARSFLLPNLEFSVETREERLYNKQKLVDSGDRWEPILAANLLADAKYR